MTKSTDRNMTTADVTAGIDSLHRSSGRGDRANAFRDTMRGINTTSIKTLLPANRDNHGITFFTRPCLNLTYDNLSRIRRLGLYRDAPPMSMARAVRVYLDPFGQGCGSKPKNNHAINTPDGRQIIVGGDTTEAYVPPFASGQMNYINEEPVGCDSPLVDRYSPFINFLTNTLTDLSGWPDPSLDYHTSDKGLMGEEHIMADGIWDKYGSFSLEAAFRTMDGHPHPLLFDLWGSYMSYVRMGDMIPYPMMLAERELDYMTRIYRFILDPTRRYITFHGACGAGFPTNNATGPLLNFSQDKPIINNGGETLNFSFQCVGAEYNDPILLDEFNRLVAIFNSELQIVGWEGGTGGYDNCVPYGNKGSLKWIKLRPSEMVAGNYNAYPLINEYTMELEWWMRVETYKQIFGE